MVEWNEQGTEAGVMMAEMPDGTSSPAEVVADETVGVAQIGVERDAVDVVSGEHETPAPRDSSATGTEDAADSVVVEAIVDIGAKDGADDAGSALALAAAPDVTLRRHRKQPRTQADATTNGAAIQTRPHPTAETAVSATDRGAELADVARDVMLAAAELVVAEALPDVEWRQHWPHNELVIFGRLDPNVSQAPTVDGVTRIRATVEIIEIDEPSGATGVVAKVPVQILPVARGFDPVYDYLRRARMQHRRIEPFPVELRGASKQLYDKDARYANTRWSMLFGLEVSLVRRVDRSVGHYGRWRGAGTVSDARPFELGTESFLRVTLSVGAFQRKAQLRGPSSTTAQVDVLVRVEHEHAQRFRHVGQRLLVEAEVYSQTSVLRATHPDLEGLDEELKERLRILREGLLLVTMGEFPDGAAEDDFAAWVKAGRPMPPGRPGRRSRPRQRRASGTVVQGEHPSASPKPAGAAAKTA